MSTFMRTDNSVNFTNSKFQKCVTFLACTFSGNAIFRNCDFAEDIIFKDTKFLGTTNFLGATFRKIPPDFNGTSLHDATYLPSDEKEWPLPKGAPDPDQFIYRYAKLKLEMERQKKHEDELRFFALEMKSRKFSTRILGRIPYYLYGMTSNYGRSITRPLLFLSAVILSFPIVEHILDPWPKSENAFKTSFANTFYFVGISKEIMEPNYLNSLHSVLQVIAGLQCVFGGIFGFLLLLALRNKFRLK